MCAAFIPNVIRSNRRKRRRPYTSASIVGQPLGDLKLSGRPRVRLGQGPSSGPLTQPVHRPSEALQWRTIVRLQGALHIPMPDPFTLIDLFAGCGGMTRGFVDSGAFTPIFAVEFNRDAANTYTLNFGDHVF